MSLLLDSVADEADEADRHRRLAAAHQVAAQEELALAQRWTQGDAGELVVRELLEAAEQQGWRALHRRAWPGTRRADIDHLLVGPGGVVVLDTKNWGGTVRVSCGRLLHGQADESPCLDAVARQIAAVEEVISPIGLAPLEVCGALVLVGHTVGLLRSGRVHVLGDDALLSWLSARGRRLNAEQIEALHVELDRVVPPRSREQRGPTAVVRPLPRPRVDSDQTSLFDLTAVQLDDVERACSQPIESWMVWLHPAQTEIVRRRYSGPSRVRGSAGCGKTVVALHRAAYLAAREPGELLFLSYVRTLPVVLSTLFASLAPDSTSRVLFTNVHRLAIQLLSEAGIRHRLDRDTARTCFNLAWLRVGRSALTPTGLPLRYWEEEVLGVIKGRGLDDFEQYRLLARTGRRTRLTTDVRRQVWDLYVCYQHLLHERGVSDFTDVVALALQLAREGATPRYRFVIVDEAQDLDLVSVQLAAALSDTGQDSLTLVGDGQQAVYPGGYTLAEAGISVVGRSTVLDINYRNTRQVLDEAQAVVRSDDFDDLEDVGESGERAVTVVREGSAVCRVVAADPASADAALLQRLADDAALGLHVGDGAVLCRTVRDSDRIHRLVHAAGFPVLSLVDYDGRPSDAVKVGTVKRAKGLEFASVYLPRLDHFHADFGSSEIELVQRERRELFVAMTRARDGLWTCRVAPPTVDSPA